MARFFVCFLSFFALLSVLPASAVAQEKELTLAQCLQVVLAKNPDMLYARANMREKEAALQSAKKNLLPSLLLEYSYTRQPASAGSSFARVPENYYNYAFTVEQPLFRGRSLVTAVDVGELDLQRSTVSYGKAKNDLLLSAHEAYYALLKARKLKDEAHQAVLRLEKHLSDVRRFYEAGMIPKNDLLASEVELAQGKQDYLKTRNQMLLAGAALNILMKQPADTPLAIEDVFSYAPYQPAWDKILAQALAARPEISQAKLDAAKAEKDIILARADYLPSITVSATYEKQGDGPGADSYPYGASEIKTAQAVAQWKLWSWGQSLDKVAGARHRLRKAKEVVSRVRDSVTLQLRKEYLNLDEAVKNIAVTEKAIQQAEENYRLNETRYEARVATSTDVLDAQTLLVNARTNYFNALYNYHVALASVRWATGTIDKSSAAHAQE